MQITTDEMGRQSRFTSNSAGRLTGIAIPGSTLDATTISYDGSDRVSGVIDATGSWTYAYSNSSGAVLTTATGPLGQSIYTESRNGRIERYRDALNNDTYFEWTGGRLTTVTYPELNRVSYTYDARGNITQVVVTAKEDIPLPPTITTSAAYPATCANPVTCNLPTSTTDPLGRVTDYTWDATHGGLLSVTGPAPTSGATRPQTRITYGQRHAWYRNYLGAMVQDPRAVTLPVETSACAVGTFAQCDGTADEVIQTVTYQAGSSSPDGLSNLLPVTTTAGSGATPSMASTATTWNNRGDPEVVTDPVGAEVRYQYNLGREVIGVIGPDPDGTGPLLNRALSITRNDLGLPTLTRQGTTSGYVPSSFAMLQQAGATYDRYGRALSQTLSDATSTFSLVQQSYDAAGRPSCTAVRMNPSTFGAPPTSACDYATAGAFGPDRISSVTYDVVSRVISATSGHGRPDAITEAVTYTPNGQVQTATDGRGRVTTFW